MYICLDIRVEAEQSPAIHTGLYVSHNHPNMTTRARTVTPLMFSVQ